MSPIPTKALDYGSNTDEKCAFGGLGGSTALQPVRRKEVDKLVEK